MNRKAVWVTFSLLTLLFLLIASCTPEATPTPTTAKPTATPTATTAAPANWWDKFGEPQYGGTITRRTSSGQLQSILVDTWNRWMGSDLRVLWYEKLFAPDWTVDHDVFPFTTDWVPPEYNAGILAESWEMPDMQTVVVNIRQGIHWRDIPPVNGREFTAEDVQFNFDRMLGTGSGFTEPNPFYAINLVDVESVVATGKYTVEFKFKQPSALALNTLFTNSQFGMIAPEWLEQGDPDDWQNAVGTGPWIMTDWVPSVSATFSRNPDYWGTDERHPENQLPYADTLKSIAVDDMATALAALRTGQIDTICEREGPSLQQIQSLAETNPDIQHEFWQRAGLSLGIRCDVEPFTDLRVRKALQMAIDLESIAQSYYGGAVAATPVGLINSTFKDWSFPYDQWPQELKDEYSYNPEKAKELLAEAGYPDGFETNIIVGDVFDLSLIQVCKSNLMDIGVDMAIEVYDMPTFNALQNTGGFDQINYFAMSGQTGGPSDFQYFLTVSQQNSSFTSDPTYDAMYYEMMAATSLDEAKRLARELDKYALEQHWQVVTLPVASPVVWQPWLKGYSGEVTEGLNSAMGTVYTRLWIDQDMKESMGY